MVTDAMALPLRPLYLLLSVDMRVAYDQKKHDFYIQSLRIIKKEKELNSKTTIRY